jgi:hypothetical protein
MFDHTKIQNLPPDLIRKIAEYLWEIRWHRDRYFMRVNTQIFQKIFHPFSIINGNGVFPSNYYSVKIFPYVICYLESESQSESQFYVHHVYEDNNKPNKCWSVFETTSQLYKLSKKRSEWYSMFQI